MHSGPPVAISWIRDRDPLEPLPPDAWDRTATVTVPGKLYEYSTLYYGDWMARHEGSHLKHIARIVKSRSA